MGDRGSDARMANDRDMHLEVMVASDDRLVAEALTFVCQRCGFIARSFDPRGGAPEGQPDVIVVDLTGDTSLRSWTTEALAPMTRIVALHGEPLLVEPHDRVDAWLPLATTVEAFLDAVRGQEHLAPDRSGPVPSDPTAFDDLTPREHEILVELLTGDGDPVIGERLGISEHTVRTHVQNILSKLGVNSRAAAASLGIRRGLLRSVAGQVNR